MLLFGSPAALGADGSGVPAHRSNVLVIVIDAWRADRLGASSAGAPLTPFLDSLAARAYVFGRAYTAAGNTSPSVASLLTARYPARHGVRWFDSVLDPRVVTLPALLRDHGFATGLFTPMPLFGGAETGVDVYRQIVFAMPARVGAAEVNAAAFRWMDGRERDPQRPLFLLLHYTDVRPPYIAPPAFMQRVTGRFKREDERDLVDMVRRANRWYLEGQDRPLRQTEMAEITAVYDASVMALDAQVRSLFKALEQRRFLDDAIVVITADRGEDLHEHGDVRLPGTLWETRFRVPLLLLVPGTSTRTDVSVPASLVDVAPTVLDLLGLPVPAGVDGRSRVPSLRPEATRWSLRSWLGWRPESSEVVYGEMPGHRGTRRSMHQRAVVQGTDELLVSRNGRRAYFDLKTDPDERHPSGLDRAARERLDRALDALDTSFASQRGPTPARPLGPRDVAELRALGYYGE